LVVKPTPVEIIKRAPLKSGIGLCLYLESSETSLRRALGRRYDRSTRTVYHLEENPPPVDNAPLIERLQSVYEVNNLE